MAVTNAQNMPRKRSYRVGGRLITMLFRGSRLLRYAESLELLVVEHRPTGAVPHDGQVVRIGSAQDLQREFPGRLTLLEAAADHPPDDPIAQQRLPAGIDRQAQGFGGLAGAGQQAQRLAGIVGEKGHVEDHGVGRKGAGPRDHLGELRVFPVLDLDLDGEPAVAATTSGSLA